MQPSKVHVYLADDGLVQLVTYVADAVIALPVLDTRYFYYREIVIHGNQHLVPLMTSLKHQEYVDNAVFDGLAKTVHSQIYFVTYDELGKLRKFRSKVGAMSEDTYRLFLKELQDAVYDPELAVKSFNAGEAFSPRLMRDDSVPFGKVEIRDAI